MSIRVCRRFTQVAFILFIFLMPVLDILRYDTAAKELIIFGNVWSLGLRQGFYVDQSMAGAGRIALQFFLKAILPWIFFLAIFPLLGFLSGRLFCGWFCPEGALFEYADFLTLKILGRRSIYGRKRNDPQGMKGNRLFYEGIAALSAIMIPVAGGIALTGYFVAPKTIWEQIISFHFSFGVKAGIVGVTIYMLTTSIFVRHAICKYICAAGLMQMLFGWASPVSLMLKLDTAGMSRCTDCKGCDRACFMGVVPRKNKRDISCVNCGACIDACNRELGHGNGLFSYTVGGGGAANKVNDESIGAVSFPEAKRLGNPSENEERFRTSRNDRQGSITGLK